MSIKPRTIDNLGVEASVDYARNQKLFEPRLIEDARLVPQKTEVSVAKPYLPSEFDSLFTVGSKGVWASFSPPPEYFSYAKPFFTFQVIPSLGDSEKQEADLDKLSALEDALKERRQQKRKDREKGDEEERKVLLSFFQCLQKLDKTLALINSRRNQYQRG